VRVAGRTIDQVCALTVREARRFFEHLALAGREAAIADKVLTEIRRRLLAIAAAMLASIKAGCRHEGILPGGLKVKRRAPRLYRELMERPEDSLKDPLTTLDWIGLFAMAVNEENAAGGRVVTAPTNGAAGIVPAVLEYYRRFVPGANDDGLVKFLLTAGAIGLLFKENASISGAEVGCQGEVGVACSMAAAGCGSWRARRRPSTRKRWAPRCV